MISNEVKIQAGSVLGIAGLMTWLNCRPLGIIFFTTLLVFSYKQLYPQARIQVPYEVQTNLKTLVDNFAQLRKDKPGAFCVIISGGLVTLAIAGHLISGAWLVMGTLIGILFLCAKYKVKIVHGNNDDGSNDKDLHGAEFRFGRHPKSEYTIAKDEGLEHKYWQQISKFHFVLIKDMNNNKAPIMIKDLSRNGTFVNGELIGQNQIRMIKNGDIISVITAETKIFDFRDLTPRAKTHLPKPVQDKFFIANKLGSGAFGDVYKLIDRKFNQYAVKYIRANNVLDRPDQVENEIKILKKLDHVCIIRTIDVMRDNTGGASLILEYMAGGNLLDRILQPPLRRLSEDECRCVLFQITHAVNYLHSKGITHRDIKPDNILLKDNEEMTLVKLTDFGLSKLVNGKTIMTSILGTPNYTAPEVLDAEVLRYTPKVDVWSMGVTLFAAISGTLPFADEYGDARAQIIAGTYQFLAPCWRTISHDAIRLIRKMLVVEPENRLNVNEIFTMKWMSRENAGVQAAIKIMEENGSRKHNIDPELKDIEFAIPRPPSKRARYQM